MEEFNSFAGKILNTLILKGRDVESDDSYRFLIKKSLKVTKMYMEEAEPFFKEIEREELEKERKKVKGYDKKDGKNTSRR